MPRCRRHDLRHLAATLLIGEGLDPKAVQVPLGHSTINVTMQLYAYAVKGKDRLAAEATEQAFTTRLPQVFPLGPPGGMIGSP